MRRLAIVVVLFGLAVTACVPRQADTTSTVPPSPTTTEPSPTTTLAPDVPTVVVGTTAQITNLDSGDAYALHDWELLGNIGVGLTAFSPGTSEVVPGIAERFEVSEDGTVYTFVLREDVAFGDGTALTATGYVAHIRRMLSVNGPGGAGEALGVPFISDVRATDDRTVVFSLHEAAAFFPAVTAAAPYSPVHPDLPADEIQPLPEPPVYGVGPWTITSYEVGDHVVLNPNPFYFGDPPAAERIMIRYFESEAEVAQALVDGEVHIFWPGFSDPDLAAEIASTSGVSTASTGGGPAFHLVINHALEPTVATGVRRALAGMVDRTALTAIAGSASLLSPVPPGFLGAAEAFADSPDIAGAEAHLIELGYTATSPLEITLTYPMDRYGDEIPQIMAALASQLGATDLSRAEPEAVEWDTYVADLTGGEALAAGLLAWRVDFFDPDPFIAPFVEFGGLGTNATDPDTGQPMPGLESLVGVLNAAATETNPEVRSDLYREAQRLYEQHVITIPLWWEPGVVSYRGVTADESSPHAEALNIGPTAFLDYSLLSLTP